MTWIQTCTGLKFDLENPDPASVRIEDIAHALSQICRFTGHTPEFYSVAQHSVLVSKVLPDRLAIQGLLHDAHEAYVGDVSSPMKRLPEMAGYREIEQRAWRAVAAAFSLPEELDPAVKNADLRMLATEKKMLAREPQPWAQNVAPYDIAIRPLSPRQAESLFLSEFMIAQSLTAARAAGIVGHAVATVRR